MQKRDQMRDAETKSVEQLTRDEIAQTSNGVRSRGTSPMIERVARVIANQPTGDLDPRWLRKATAAISAMMEPTEAMVATGYDAISRAGDVTVHNRMKSAYVAMLRKALWP